MLIYGRAHRLYPPRWPWYINHYGVAIEEEGRRAARNWGDIATVNASETASALRWRKLTFLSLRAVGQSPTSRNPASLQSSLEKRRNATMRERTHFFVLKQQNIGERYMRNAITNVDTFLILILHGRTKKRNDWFGSWIGGFVYGLYASTLHKKPAIVY